MAARCRCLSSGWGWILKFDLAGVRLEDVQVHVSKRTVMVSGVRRDCMVEDGCRHYSMEITYSRFAEDDRVAGRHLTARNICGWITATAFCLCGFERKERTGMSEQEPSKYCRVLPLKNTVCFRTC